MALKVPVFARRVLSGQFFDYFNRRDTLLVLVLVFSRHIVRIRRSTKTCNSNDVSSFDHFNLINEKN